MRRNATRRCPAAAKKETLRYGASFSLGRVIQGAYVDDLISAGLVPRERAACTPGHASDCPHCREDGGLLPDVETLQWAMDSYAMAGAEVAEGKTTPLSNRFTAWGTDVDGLRGVVGVGADKRRQTFGLCVAVILSGRLYKSTLRSLVGTLV